MKHAVFLALALACQATAQAAPDVQAGRAVFKARCASCHSMAPRSTFGPHLHAIVGRPAAAAGDYRYSPAMKASGIVWSRQSLAAFVQAPGEVVPGTTMRFRGIGDGKQLEDLLAYLQSQQ
jgi:cytochrome c